MSEGLREALEKALDAMPYKRWTVTLEGDWENGWVASATSRPLAGLGIEVTTVPVVWGYDRVGAPTLEAALDALHVALAGESPGESPTPAHMDTEGDA